MKITSYGGALPKLVLQGTITSDGGREGKARFSHDFLKNKTSYEAVESHLEIVSLERGEFSFMGNPSKAEEIIRKKLARAQIPLNEDQIQELLAQIPKENLV